MSEMTVLAPANRRLEIVSNGRLCLYKRRGDISPKWGGERACVGVCGSKAVKQFKKSCSTCFWFICPFPLVDFYFEMSLAMLTAIGLFLREKCI